jgi:hypothetical protein
MAKDAKSEAFDGLRTGRSRLNVRRLGRVEARDTHQSEDCEDEAARSGGHDPSKEQDEDHASMLAVDDR